MYSQYKVTRRGKDTAACAFRQTYLRDFVRCAEGERARRNLYRFVGWTTSQATLTMLITKTQHDIPSKLSLNGRAVRIFVISPSVPNYPEAKFPGELTFVCSVHNLTVCVDRNRSGGLQVRTVFMPTSLQNGELCVHSEIYQVTGPVERFAGQLASHGYVVGEDFCDLRPSSNINAYLDVACPSSFHEFEGPEPIPYDTEGLEISQQPVPVRFGLRGFICRNRQGKQVQSGLSVLQTRHLPFMTSLRSSDREGGWSL